MGTARKPKGVSRTTKNHNAASGRQPGGWPPSPHHMSHDDARLLQFGLFNIALRVMESKRYDYSGDEDPYRNFRFSAGVGVEPWRGALVRMLDKVSRIVRFAELSGDMKVKDESLIDTVVDLINYACIAFGLIIESLPPEDRAYIIARLEGEARSFAN
jgi:hypothetical protein